MTVTSTTSRNDYAGAGSTGPYAYGFRIYAATDLLVTKASSTGVETTLVYPTDFSVTGVSSRTGGTITLATALAVGETLTIRRVLPLTQLINLRNQGATFPANVEDGLDQSVMREQQIDNDLQASVRLAETVDPATFDTRLPANLVAGDAIVVNGAGTGFSQAALTSAQLSAWSATHNLILDRFTSGVNFTPGVSTTLTLSANPGNEDNLLVTARVSGTVRVFEHDEYSLTGTTLTFGSVIPAGATYIEVTYMYTYQVNTAASENVSYSNGGAGAVTTNVRAKLRETLSVKDFGAVGDGTTDDRAAIVAACTAAGVSGGAVFFPAGTYNVASNLTISNAHIILVFAPNALLKTNSGAVTITVSAPVSASLYPIADISGGGSIVIKNGVFDASLFAGATDTLKIAAALAYVKSAAEGRGTIFVPASMDASAAVPALNLSNSQAIALIDYRADRAAPNFGGICFYVEGRDWSGGYASEFKIRGLQNPAFVADTLSDGSAPNNPIPNKVSTFLHQANGVDVAMTTTDVLAKGDFDWVLWQFANGGSGAAALYMCPDANLRARFDFTYVLFNTVGLTISAATNASPIELTFTTPHGLLGYGPMPITVAGCLGNTAANGDWNCDFVSTTKVTLRHSTGNGAYGGGGTATVYPGRQRAIVNLPKSSSGELQSLWAEGPIGTEMGYMLQEGVKATSKMGIATLVAGTVTVLSDVVYPNSRIFCFHQNANGTVGFLGVSARVNGTSFTITSSNVADVSDVAWIIFEKTL